MKMEDWSDVSTDLGMPEIVGKPPGARRSKAGLPTGY